MTSDAQIFVHLIVRHNVKNAIFCRLTGILCIVVRDNVITNIFVHLSIPNISFLCMTVKVNVIFYVNVHEFVHLN